MDLRRFYLQMTVCYRLVYSGELEIEPSVGTRGSSAPSIKQARLKLEGLIRDPIYQLVSHWNALDPALRWSQDKTEFKNELKKKLNSLFNKHWIANRPWLLFQGRSYLREPD